LIGQLGSADELIVVDNGSTDGSAELVRERYPEATLIAAGCNLGFSGGNNVGMRAAAGEQIILVNQDVIVHEGWLEAILSALLPEAVGIVGSKLVYPDGRIQHAGGTLIYPGAHPDHLGYRQVDDGRWDALRAVEYVTGAAIGISRSVLDRVGYLDEGFTPAFYEEVDLCARARDAGYQVSYVPGAVATHLETTTVSRASVDYHRWMNRGRLRYVLKHYAPAQFFGDFVPAERQWLASLGEATWRRSLQLAYLDSLLGLKSVPPGGVLTDSASLQAVADALIELRAAISCVPARDPGWARGPASQRGPNWAYRARTAILRAPLVGEIASGLRRLWNSVIVRSLTRPLLIQDQLDCVVETTVRLDREAADSHRVVAGALYGLQEQITAIEARLDDLARSARGVGARDQ
jgi:GT2 family glycosyltransferase